MFQVPIFMHRSTIIAHSFSEPHKGVPKPRQIFQVNPPFRDVSLYDVTDAFQATTSMKVDDKRGYFYTQGIDYDNAMRYIGLIVSLNLRLNN